MDLGKNLNLREERAVTLTALVVTIIVMIILAAVSVLGIFGENGIFKSSITAKKDTETAAYSEELKAIEVQTRTQELKSGSDFVYLKAFESNVKNNSMFANAREIGLRNDESVLRIVTEEGYIFYIADEETEGVIEGGIDGETEEPKDLYPGNGSSGSGSGGSGSGSGETPTPPPEGAIVVSFSYSTESLTKDPVKVTINVDNMPNQQLQYKIDNGVWRNIDNGGQVEVNKCGTVYARLSNGHFGGSVVKTEITWIDTVAPRNPSLTYTSTQDTIDVTAYATDPAKTATSASSGNVMYAYKITGNGITKNTWSSYQTNGNFTFDSSYGLVENGTYTIYVKAKDGVGNETNEVTASASTTRVPDGEKNIEISANAGTSESSWTKEPVTVTIKNIGGVTGYTLVYSLDGTNYTAVPSDGKLPLITENGTRVYAAFQNAGKSHGTPVTLDINYIDTEEPNLTATITQVTSNKIAVKAIADDNNTNDGKSGTSGIVKYSYSKDGETNFVDAGMNDTYEFTGLDDGTNYTIMVKVVDKAGNEKIATAELTKADGSKTTTITTDKVADLGPGDNSEKDPVTGDIKNPNVTFNKNPDNKYVKSVIVTPVINVDISGFTVKYQKDREGWKDFTEGTGITFTQNGTLVIMATDGKNSGTTATCTISNVDSLAPEMTKLENITLPVDDEREGVLKFKAGAEDKATDKYTSSGLQELKYCYGLFGQNDYSDWQTLSINQSSEIVKTKEIEFEIAGLETGKKYTIKLKAIDNLENESMEKTIDIVVPRKAVPNLEDKDKDGVPANISFKVDPEDWTNGTVNVKAKLTKEIEDLGYELKYTKDKNQNNWENFTSDGVNFTENGSLFLKLQDPSFSENVSEIFEKEIENIDKTAPNSTFTFKTQGNNASKITVSAKTTDVGSGVASFKFKYAEETRPDASDSSLSWSSETPEIEANISGSASYTFKGLDPNTTYRIKAIATDKVGNPVESTNHISKTTAETGASIGGGTQGGSELENPIDNKISYKYTPSAPKTETDKWTKTGETDEEKVKVELIFDSVDPTKFNVEYTVDDGENWVPCNLAENPKPVFYVEHNGLIRARLVNKEDGAEGDDYWGEVWWIDNIAPAQFTIRGEAGIGEITVLGHSSGDYGSDGYASSGIKKYVATCYEARLDSTLTEEEKWANAKEVVPTAEQIASNSNIEIKFSNLTPIDGEGNAIEYKILMKAIDGADNESIVGENTCIPEELPEIKESDITYKFSNIGEDGNQKWVKANELPIKLTVQPNATIQNYINTLGCKLVYKIAENDSYKEYTDSGITINQATYVDFALKYNDMMGKGFTLAEYAKIDIVPPSEYVLVDSTDVLSTTTSLRFRLPVASLVDNGATVTSNGEEKTISSGINPNKFKFELENFLTEELIESKETTEPEYTFSEGLVKNTEYKVIITYYDNAGNAKTIEAIKKTDTELVTKAEMVKFTQRPDAGTDSANPKYAKDYVIVSIDYNPEYAEYEKISNYDIYYCLRNSSGTTVQDWTKYIRENTEIERKTTITIKENNTTVAVQLRDSVGDGNSSASTTVAHLDTEAPVITANSSYTIGTGATFAVTISDNGISSSNNKLKGYYVTENVDENLSNVDASTITWTSCNKGTVNISIPKRNTLGTYTYYLWACDLAGNIGAKKQISVTVQKYLVDAVALGDYVQFDFTYTGLDSSESGWRVLSKSGSGSSGTVKIISTGFPLTYGSALDIDSTAQLNNLNVNLAERYYDNGWSPGFVKSSLKNGTLNLAGYFNTFPKINVSAGVRCLNLDDVKQYYKSLTGTALPAGAYYYLTVYVNDSKLKGMFELNKYQQLATLSSSGSVSLMHINDRCMINAGTITSGVRIVLTIKSRNYLCFI